jgi:hypothetical protein
MNVLLVGHCGPDSTYLRMTVRHAEPQARILLADDDEAVQAALNGEVSLMLINRELGYGFQNDQGVALIKWVHENYPRIPTMLVSNYPEAQKDAEAAGAIPGFGKRDIGTQRVTTLLRNALSVASHK